MYRDLEHPEITRVLRTGYPSWMQKRDEPEEDEDDIPFDVDDETESYDDFDAAAARTEIRNLNKTGTADQKKAVKAILNGTGCKLDELEDINALTQMLEIFE